LCANLADPALASAARGGRPAAAVSGGHGPPPTARGGGAAPGLSTGQGPPPIARGGSAAPTAALGLSIGHGLLPGALLPLLVCQPGTGFRLVLCCRSWFVNRAWASAWCSAATLGLSAGHGPRHAAHSCGHAAVAASGLSAGHEPRRATRSRGPTATAGLRWTWVFGFNF